MKIRDVATLYEVAESLGAEVREEREYHQHTGVGFKWWSADGFGDFDIRKAKYLWISGAFKNDKRCAIMVEFDEQIPFLICLHLMDRRFHWKRGLHPIPRVEINELITRYYGCQLHSGSG